MVEAFCKDKLGPFVLRLALGLVCACHGYLKIRADGGTNWYPGWPVAWQLAVAWGEFAAGLAILVGFRCRWAAALALALLVATAANLYGMDFFRQPLPALEPAFLTVLLCLALLFLGAGELSVDARGGGSARAASPRRAR